MLGRVPPALIITAEHDPLRDEGDLFAARLAAAGVPVQHRCEPRMIHGFLTLDTVSPAAAQAGSASLSKINVCHPVGRYPLRSAPGPRSW